MLTREMRQNWRQHLASGLLLAACAVRYWSWYRWPDPGYINYIDDVHKLKGILSILTLFLCGVTLLLTTRSSFRPAGLLQPLIVATLAALLALVELSVTGHYRFVFS